MIFQSIFKYFYKQKQKFKGDVGLYGNFAFKLNNTYIKPAAIPNHFSIYNE